MSDFSFWVILKNLIWATQWTIALSLIAFIGGGIVGLILLFLRTSQVKWLEVPTKLYIEFFQGTPLLMQLFLFFFGVALFGIEVSPWTAAGLALTLWTSAFLTEIWRGCVEAIPKGQWEASASVATWASAWWGLTQLVVRICKGSGRDVPGHVGRVGSHGASRCPRGRTGGHDSHRPPQRGEFPTLDLDGSEITVKPADSAPYAAFVWKTIADPFAGRITMLRVINGLKAFRTELSKASPSWNLTPRRSLTV